MELENKNLYLVFAGVLFVIGLEYLLARTKGKTVFRFHNTISNFLMGAFDRVAGLFMVPLIYIYYEFLYDHFSLFVIPDTTVIFFFAVLLSDFIWYFYHKSGHQVNIFWGAHIIHHQSEDYNYTVALNLTPFQVFIRVLFWSVMSILGFTPLVVLKTHIVIGLYQFLLHTTLIPKLGIIEKLFVTPSHHRVHHGSNEEYLDKNYGGVLIIWDRLFGTFQEEQAEVKYGITKDINSRDFIVSVFHYYQNLWYMMKQIPSLKEKLLLLIKGPEWQPASGPVDHLPLYIDKGSYEYKAFGMFDKLYIWFNTVLALIIIPITSYFASNLNGFDFVFVSFFVLSTLVINGRLLEGKKSFLLIFIKLIVACSWAYYFINR